MMTVPALANHDGRDARRRLALGCLVAATAATVLVHVPSAGAGAYECDVRDALTSGIVPNTIRAEGSVDCSGYGGPGSVRFSVRLQRFDAGAREWRTLKVKVRTYTRLRVKHKLAADKKPCAPGKYRGIFKAALRDGAGHHVSTNVQRLGTLRVLEGCAVDNPFELPS
jgi:hypothetical protein